LSLADKSALSSSLKRLNTTSDKDSSSGKRRQKDASDESLLWSSMQSLLDDETVGDVDGTAGDAGQSQLLQLSSASTMHSIYTGRLQLVGPPSIDDQLQSLAEDFRQLQANSIRLKAVSGASNQTSGTILSANNSGTRPPTVNTSLARDETMAENLWNSLPIRGDQLPSEQHNDTNWLLRSSGAAGGRVENSKPFQTTGGSVGTYDVSCPPPLPRAEAACSETGDRKLDFHGGQAGGGVGGSSMDPSKSAAAIHRPGQTSAELKKLRAQQRLSSSITNCGGSRGHEALEVQQNDLALVDGRGGNGLNDGRKHLNHHVANGELVTSTGDEQLGCNVAVDEVRNESVEGNKFRNNRRRYCCLIL
jgi:hypothetical protein